MFSPANNPILDYYEQQLSYRDAVISGLFEDQDAQYKSYTEMRDSRNHWANAFMVALLAGIFTVMGFVAYIEHLHK